MLLLAALQLNILKRAKNHHFPNTEINNRVGDGTYLCWDFSKPGCFVTRATGDPRLVKVDL